MLLKTLVISWFFLPVLALGSVGKIEKVGLGKSVKVARSGNSMHLQEGDPLESGDEVITDASTAVDIRLEDETLIRVGINSKYTMQEDSKIHKLVHRLLAGVVRVLVKPTDRDHKDPNIKFRMQTPEGTIGVRGTEFVVLRSNGKTQLKGLDGEVIFGPANSDFSDTSSFVSVARGFESEIDASGSGAPSKPQKFDWKSYSDGLSASSGSFGPLANRQRDNSGRVHARKGTTPPAPAASASQPTQVANATPPAVDPAPAKDGKPKDEANKDWQSVLMHAALESDVAKADNAIKKGADVNATSVDGQGYTPLQAAIAAVQGAGNAQEKEMIFFLIRKGADVNLASADTGDTPLMIVAREGLSAEYAEMLVNPGGAETDFVNKAGKSASDIAKETGNTAVYKYLTSDQVKEDEKAGQKALSDRKAAAAAKAKKNI